MKQGWLKKVGMVLGIIASLIVIGNAASGWMGDKDKTTDDTTTETACIECVIDA